MNQLLESPSDSRTAFFAVAGLLVLSFVMFIFCVQNAVWLSDCILSLVQREIVGPLTSNLTEFPNNYWVYACIASVQSLVFVLGVGLKVR